MARTLGARNKKKKGQQQADLNAVADAVVANAIGNDPSVLPAQRLLDFDEHMLAMPVEVPGSSSSAADDLTANQQTDICSQIVKGRIEEDTRRGYERTLRFIVTVLMTLCPAAVNATTGMLVLPMALAHLMKFLGEVAKEKSDKTVRAVSTITGYINAIKHAHTEASINLAKEVEDFLGMFVNGYSRLVAKKKEKGQMKNFEGKVTITFNLYAMLSKKALFASDLRSPFSRFVHLFGILCWNMFARSNSVGNLRTHHIYLLGQ